MTDHDATSAAGARPGFLARLAATIPGPVFMREINAAGRRTWTYVTRGLFVMGLAGIMGLIFVSHIPALRASTTGLAQVQALQGLAPTATASLVWFLFVTLSLAAASQCGGAICDERRKGSLASLLTTPLAAWEIIMGKLLAGLAELLLLGLASMPLLLAVRVFGGLSAETVFASFGVMIPSIILTASFTVLASIGARHASAAMLTGLGATIALWLLPPLSLLLIDRSWSSRFGAVWFDFVPPYVLGRVTTELIFGQSFGVTASVPWYVAGLASLAASGVVLMVATALLRRTLAREASGATPVVPGGGKSVKTPRSREVGDQPVLWREVQVRRGRRWWRMLRWPVAITLIASLWYLGSGVDSDDAFYPVAFVGILLCLIIAATSTAGAISTERESRTLDSLLATPLTPADIVKGKFLGAMRHMWFWPTIIIGHYVVMAIVVQAGIMSTARSAWPLLAYPLILVPPMAALCASGVLMSALIRKTSTATTVNICLGVAVWLGLPILAAILSQMFRPFLTEREVLGPILLVNPVSHMFATTDAGMRDREVVNLLGLDDISWPTYATVLGVYSIAYLATARGLLAAASRSRAWTGGANR
ncbi:MAG: ABC transporter permease subunit [Phycisphaerales bacterium]